MKRSYLLFFLVLMVFTAIGVSAQENVTGAEPIELELVLNDFESGVPIGTAPDGSSIGFVPWGDVAENVQLSARQLVPFSTLAIPGTNNVSNTVLAVNYDIGGWGGYTYAITDGTEWLNMDWTPYNALSFWLYGNETGGTVQVDLFDNRAEGIAGDTAERYFYRLTDDYTGWKQITIPFALFQRRTDFQPGSAPNDGLGLDAVTGYAIGFPTGAGEHTAYVDQFGLTTVEDETAVIWIGETREEEVSTVDTSITWDSRDWELMWSDEFDGPAGTPINDEFWSFDTGGQGWGNNQLEYDTNRVENASLDGEGNLAITAREENPNNYTCHYGTCDYTSARILTRDKVEFTYGRVEARIRIPRGQGIWPAFWMLGANFGSVGWPNSGEIDIMENVGHEDRLVHGTVHGPGYSGGQGIGGSRINSGEAYANDFHVYAVDWDTDAIRWYVDGDLFFTMSEADLNGRTWVYDHDFFIILNVAVGGNWPGSPNATTVFPQTMLVDYVRVYQLAEAE